MGFQPPAEVERLGSFGEVVSWTISAWAPPDGPRSIREMVDAGLVRESNTVATGDAGIAANNHAKWYVLLGQSGLENFRELSLRRDRSWRNAETEASKVTRQWFKGPGAGMEKVDHLAHGLLLPAEVAAWIRDRRRSLPKSAAPFRSASVMAAVEATRDLVRDHRIFDRWLSELRPAMTSPAPWQPSWVQDIPRWSLPLLTERPLTVVVGEMGSGKSRYIRRQLARYVQNVSAAGPVRRIVPLILDAEQLPDVVAGPDPWASAVRAFLADYSAGISTQDRDRLADLLVSRSRSGDIGVVVACDGLDELPHRTLMRLLDQASGPIIRFLRAQSASVVLGVRSGTDAERLVNAFAESVTGDSSKPVPVSALTRRELLALAQAWRVRLSPHRLDEFLTRHPTMLLAACTLATGAIEQNDSELLESAVRRLLAGEWKAAAAEVTPPRMDAALAAAAEVAFAMAADQAEWRYSAPAEWVRRRVTAVAGEAGLTAVERLLPRLLQRYAREVTWAHAAVQEFLVGWHLGNGIPGAEAREFLRRRWWQHAQWRRVTVHTAACTHDLPPLLDLLAEEARTDPFAILDQLLLECASVAPVPVSAKKDALGRLRPQAKAMVPISRRLGNYGSLPPDGLKRVPELLRSLGGDAFAGFATADFLFPQSGWEAEHHNKAGEPEKYHLSPLFLSALRAGVPVAVQLFRRCFGLMRPGIPIAPLSLTDGGADVVSAAVPWIDTTELLLLNDPSREHWWISDEARLAIAAELWVRGCKAHISRLPYGADIGPLMANLGPAATAALLSTRCQAGSEVSCGQSDLVTGADVAIERSSTDHLNALLREPSITAPVRVAAALQLVRRGETLSPGLVTRECVTQALTHQCYWSDPSPSQAVELLDGLLSDQRFGWAEDALAGTTSVSAVLALARNGRRGAARAVFDRVLAQTSKYGIKLLPLLDADLDLTESEVVQMLQHTHHSGDPVDKEDDDRIYRALRRLPPDARRAVWNYAAPDGHVRLYVQAGFVIEKRMLHEVLSLDELRDAVRSARTMGWAVQWLRSVLQVSLPDARSLAAEIADKGWEEHLAACGSHLSCRLFAGLSELFPASIREEVAIHGNGLELIAAGRYDLIQEWRPSQYTLDRAISHRALARGLAAAANNDAAALERLKVLALTHDDYETALTESNPLVGRSVMESRVISNTVAMDENRAYRMLKLGSQLAVDWYVRAIAESVRTSTPWFTGKVDEETALAIMRRLLQEWASRTGAKSKANLAAAMYDVWGRCSESLTDEATHEIRRALAQHADGIAACLASLAAAPAAEGKAGSPPRPAT